MKYLITDFLKKHRSLICVAAVLAPFYLTVGCPLRFLVGISCPGCGMSRAVEALLCFDFERAYLMHPLVFLLPVAVAVYFLVEAYTPGADLKYAVIAVAVVVLIWRTITKVADFLTKAIKVDEKFLKIVDGRFARRVLLVKYDKIQYVTGRQCVIAKHFGIQKGTISLLASLKNRIHELPYFKKNDMEQLKNKLI